MAKTYHWPGEKSSRVHSRPARTPRQKLKAALTPAQQRARQPVVPGGTLTRRQLRRTTNAEAKVKYAPLEAQQRQQVGEAQSYQHDIGGYYDQYLRQVAQQQENVNTISQQANAAMANLQGGVTGLAAADLTGIQGQANQDARSRGVTAGDQTQMASNAAAVRQALVGSFAAEQAARGDAASRYSNMIAHMVAPGQKLQAVAQAAGRVRQAQEAQTTTAREKGAFKLAERQSLTADEAKNVLARQIAGVGAATKQATIRETVRSHKAGESIDRARIRAEQAKARQQAALAAGKRTTTGPFAGLTQAEINGMSDTDATKRIRAYEKSKGAKGGKGGSGGGGGPRLTPGQTGEGLTQITKLRGFAEKAKAGQPFVPGHGKQKPLGYDAAVQKLIENTKVLKSPYLAYAVADAVYRGQLSDSTVQGLHASGFKVADVMRLLNVSTEGRARARTRKNTRAYGKTPPQPQGHA